MNRSTRLRQISNALGPTAVYWAGLRSDDIHATAADLSNLAGSYSIMGGDTSGLPSLLHEDLTGTRVDADRWDISGDLQSPATIEFRRSLLRDLGERSALLPYRSSQFLSAIAFARRETCTQLGLFGGHQGAFEHKPWVETELQKCGVNGIPWRYIPDEEATSAGHLLEAGPILVRRSRSSGGEGLALIRTERELLESWPHSDEGFAAVAPYFDGALPMNIGATVWHDGITVGRPSVQLIGVPECTSRRFGYCGNDFGLASALEADALDRIERQTRRIGEWLRANGYLGSFGVDALLIGGEPLFTEVNPRFQGSTHLAARISADLDESCLFLDHIAAWLGFDSPRVAPLAIRMRDIPQMSHIIVHWGGRAASRLDPELLVDGFAKLLPLQSTDMAIRPSLRASTGAPVARLSIADSVTQDGFSLKQEFAQPIGEWQSKAVNGLEVGQ